MDHKVNLLDFSKMRVNLALILPGQTFLEVFPQFQHKKAYAQASDDEIIVAITLCDRSGPFSTIRNFEERLKAIFSWKHYPIDGDRKELYESVLSLKNDNVADVWTEYLANLFDHEWVSWFSNSVMYYQLMTQLRKPIEISLEGTDDKESETKWNKRLKLEQKADDIYKKMKAMEDILFIDESIKRRAAQRERENKIENYPEKFADSNSVI